ncbi:hypothetical protein [Streptomyces sp. NPDC000880]
MATSTQATVCHIGIAAGPLTGGIVLEGTGAGALPRTAIPLISAALAIVGAARRQRVPGPTAPPLPRRWGTGSPAE